MEWASDEIGRLIIRWGAWLFIVLLVAIIRSCYEYIIKNGKVAWGRVLALFVMTICAGGVTIFLVSVSDLPPAAEAVIVVLSAFLCLRLIDAIVSINVKTLTELFVKWFWAGIDAIRSKNTKDDD